MEQVVSFVVENFKVLIDIFLHLDLHLNEFVIWCGPWVYLALFAIIFCETGLVVTPFLPGDSLLFALGALAALENSPLNIAWLMGLLYLAALMGDLTNYTVGYRIGPRVFSRENSRWFNREHLIRTQKFYEKHGGKTIIIARFMPIVRTFAPFVAGIGRMKFVRFAQFSVVGGFLWIFSFLLAGYHFGHLPIIKSRFHIVIVAIIGISLMPLLIEYLRSRSRTINQKLV